MTRWHFIGVGGSGMSAVAKLAAARGIQVTGSDRGESAYFAALRDAGMDVRVGHDPANVDGADAVVISSAIRDSNPELARARDLGLEVLHRSEALVQALAGQRQISVAGAHGKTTTTAMVATALHGAGINASFAVGAKVFGVDGAVAGGYAGTAGIAAVEADESDGSFLRFNTEVGVLLNIAPDHLDHYGSEEALNQAFEDFAKGAKTLIACAEDAAVMEVARTAAAAGVEVITYGFAHADVTVTATEVRRGGQAFALTVPVPGDHQRLNAAAAWTAAVTVGADPQRAAQALGSFAGTGRRYQLRGTVGSVRVVDDYAHHPDEVAAVLAAARAAGQEHLVVLFQPALFTRTQLHAQNFADALSIDNADVVVAGVYGDREDPIPGVNSEGIVSRMNVPSTSSAQVVEDLAEAARVAADLARPGSQVMTIGSGSVTLAADWILDELRARQGGHHG